MLPCSVRNLLSRPLRNFVKSSYQRRSYSSIEEGGSGRKCLVRQGAFAISVTGIAYAASAAYKVEVELGSVRRFWNKVMRTAGRGLTQTIAPQITPTNTIIGINTTVFASWLFARSPLGYNTLLHRVLENNFVSRLYSPRGLPLLLSSFSHASLGHFLLNNMALHSFGKVTEYIMTPSTMMATFAAGGTLSAYGANVYNYLRRGPGALKGGLGSSGALLTFLAISSVLPGPIIHPIGMPMLSVTGLQAVCLLSAIDILGLLRGWTMIGHAAHLSGTCFGLWIAYAGGAEAIHSYESFMASQYYKLRKKFT